MTPQLLQGQGLALLPTGQGSGRVVLCRPEVLVPRAWPGIVVPHSKGICSRPGAEGEEHWHESETWVIVSMLMLKYCVTLVKSLPLSGPQFPTCEQSHDLHISRVTSIGIFLEFESSESWSEELSASLQCHVLF